MKRLIQQGDVLLEEVDSIPNEVKRKEVKGKIVLAEGELTGHAHKILDIAGVEFSELNGEFYLKNIKDTDLLHEEHHTITIPKGKWKVRKVKEYDHFEEETRDVKD